MKNILKTLLLVNLFWLPCLQAAAIHDAIQLGDINMVRAHLVEDPNRVNLLSDYESTPLYLAVYTKNNQIVKLLLAVPGIAVNALQPSNGETALHLAAHMGNRPIVKSLLEHPNIDINMFDRYGRSALVRAAAGDHPVFHIQIVGDILADPRFDPNIINDSGEPQLQAAFNAAAENEQNGEEIKAVLQDYNRYIQELQDRPGQSRVEMRAFLGGTYARPGSESPVLALPETAVEPIYERLQRVPTPQ